MKTMFLKPLLLGLAIASRGVRLRHHHVADRAPPGRRRGLAGATQPTRRAGVRRLEVARSNRAMTPRLTNTMRCVVSAVTRELPAAWQGGWESALFVDKEPNAFALPGGKVGLYTGIFTVARNQDQLGGRDRARNRPRRVAPPRRAHHPPGRARPAHCRCWARSSVRVMARAPPMRRSQGGSILAQTGFLLPGSRAQETEADVVGQRLMAQAGFDPRQAVNLWQNMIAASGSRPPQWLSTHPDPQSRIRELQQRAADLVPVYEQARANGRRPNCG